MRKVAAVFSVLLVLGVGLTGSFVAVSGTVEAAHSTPGTVIVDDDGGAGVNTTIQAGINHADPGDTVLVRAGTYEESVVVNTTNIDIVTSEGATLDGGTVSGPAFNVTNAEGNVSNVGIRGFTVQNYDTGVSIVGTDVTGDSSLDMRNITVLNNTFQDVSGTAVSAHHESGEFELLTVTNNTVTNAGDGVSVNVNGSTATENVTVFNNSMGGEVSGSAVSLAVRGADLTDANVLLNNGSASETGLDVFLGGSGTLSDLNATGNDFTATTGNGIAVETGASASATLETVDLTANLLNESSGTAFSVDSPSATLDISGLNLTESDLSTSAAAVAIDVGATSTVTDVNVSANAINDSTSGAGVNVTARTSATVDGLTVTTNDASQNANGVVVDARGSSTVSGIAITTNLLGESDGDAVSLGAAGGTVRDVTIDSNGLNASASGLAVDATGGGTVSNVTAVSNNASRGTDGLVVTAAGSSVVEDLNVTDVLLNDTAGTGVRIAADGPSEVRNVSLDTVDASGNAAGIAVYANDSATVANLTATSALFGDASGDAGLLDAESTASIEGATFDTVGLNESAGTGLQLLAEGESSVTDVVLDTVSLSDNAEGLNVSASDSATVANLTADSVLASENDAFAAALRAGTPGAGAATIENVSIANAGLNATTSGDGLRLRAWNASSLDGVSLDTVNASSNQQGLDAVAAGDGRIANLSADSVLFGQSDDDAGTITAGTADGDAATVENVTFATIGFNESAGTGLAILANGDSTVSDVALDTVSLSNNAAGLALYANDTSRIANVSADSLLASGNDDGAAGLFAGTASAGSATIENVSLAEAGLNDTVSGTGLTIEADGSSTVDDVSLDTVDASNNTQGLAVSAAGSASITGLSTDTVLFGEASGDAGVIEAESTATVEDVSFASTGFNESAGTGLAILASGDGGVTDVSLDTVTVGNNAEGLNLSALGSARIANLSADTVLASGNDDRAAGLFAGSPGSTSTATVTNVSFSSVGLNDTAAGSGLRIESWGEASVTDVSLDTVSLSNNTVGTRIFANEDSTIAGISSDTALFGENDDRGVRIRAGQSGTGSDASITDLSFSSVGLNDTAAGSGLRIDSWGTSEVRNVSLDTVDASNNTRGLFVSAGENSRIANLSADTALFGESAGDAAVLRAAGDATVEAVSFETVGLNNSVGTGLDVLATDTGTVSNVSLNTVLAGNNTEGMNLTATDGATVSNVSADTALFGENDDGVRMLADGGTIEEVSFETVGLNNSVDTGLGVLASGTGTVSGISLDLVLAGNNTVGMNLTAVDSATVSNVSAETALFSDNEDGVRLATSDDALVGDVKILQSGLNKTTGNGIVFAGDGGTYSRVRVVETLIQANDEAGVLVTPNATTEGLRVRRSLIANNTLGIDNRNDTGVFDARNNWWGDSSGPSSAPGADTPYADPVNGKLAIGDGDSVSEGATPGVSNVRFDPAIGGKNRNEEDDQIFDPVTFIEGSNGVPANFSVEFAGITIEGPLSDFVGVNVWERSVLPLRGDDDDAANTVRNAQVFIRTDDGDVSINRDFLKVYQQGQQLNVTFRMVNGANTTRFANEEVQFHVFRANDTESLSGAFSQSINETTGEVSIGSDDVEIVELQDGQLDGSGEADFAFTPDRAGEYLFALTTIESGDGFELNDTGTGRLTANVLNDSTVFAGLEAITVQQTDSEVTPDTDRVVAGDSVTFTAESNLASADVDHAVLLYDRIAFERKQITINDTTLDVSGDDVLLNVTGTSQENGTAPLESFLLSINATQDGTVNGITTSGSLERVPYDVRIVLSGDSTQNITLSAPANVSFTGEEKTFQYVHAAVASDNSTRRSTDVGTLTVVKPASDVVATPLELDFGALPIGGSATESLNLSNEGNAPVNLSSIAITGTGAAAFNITSGGPTALAPGDSTTLDVQFAPASAGTRVAQIEITTNETDSPTVFVPLSGSTESPRPPLEVDTPVSNATEFRFRIRGLLASKDLNLSTPGLGDGDVLFDGVNIRTSRSVSTPPEIEIRFRQSTGVPGNVPALANAGDVARYLNVTPVGLDDDDIESVRFRFRVSDGRLGDRDPENVALFRFSDGSWSALDTTFVRKTSGGYNRFVATSPGFSAFAVALQEANLAITDATLDPESVLTGENATASATIENNGSAGGNFTAQLTVDGTPEATQTVFVPAGETRTVEFTVSFDAAGEYDLAINGTDAGTLVVSEPPTIAVDPASVDFGDVDVGGTATDTVTVTNEGDVALDLTSVSVTGSDAGAFSVTDAGDATVAPGASTTIQVEFAPSSGGAKSAQLEIGSNDPAAPTTAVPLAGTGVPLPDIARSPTSISFGSVTTGDSATRSVLVANFGNAPLEITSTGITGMDAGAFTIVEGGSSTVAPGEQTEIRIRFAPGSVGPKMAQFAIESNDPDEGTVTVPLIGMGAGVPEITPSTDALEFGTVTVGDSATEEATIENTGNAPLTITGVTVTGPDAGAFEAPTVEEPITLAPGESVTEEITFSPTAAGEQTATLAIESDDPAQSTTLIELTGTGEAFPAIAVDPASVEFGEVTVGESATDSVEITNEGDAPLAIDSVSVTGGDAGAFSATGADATVAPGETTTVQIEFAPASTGEKSAQLEIESNDPDEGTVTVDLAGTGVATPTEPPETPTEPPETPTEPPETPTEPPETPTSEPPTTEPPTDDGPPVALIVIVVVLLIVGILAALYFRGGPGFGDTGGG